jgi:hypothetical protein
MKRLFMVFGLVILGACLNGCATTNQDDPERVSTIPWNRPQNWEGTGAMGGFRPPGSY